MRLRITIHIVPSCNGHGIQCIPLREPELYGFLLAPPRPLDHEGDFNYILVRRGRRLRRQIRAADIPRWRQIVTDYDRLTKQQADFNAGVAGVNALTPAENRWLARQQRNIGVKRRGLRVLDDHNERKQSRHLKKKNSEWQQHLMRNQPLFEKVLTTGSEKKIVPLHSQKKKKLVT